MPNYRIAKGGLAIEQLNIEGKRSGKGFVAHKAMLISALSRALANRVMLVDIALGRKGLLNYLKALGGNVVKIIPSNGSASEAQAADEGLKVICGASTSYLANNHWVSDKMPLTFCEVRVSPSNAVKPNVGAAELAEALTKVLPFTATDDARPILQCVKFEAKDGKLYLISADGFRLAVVSLDYDDGEGQALINRIELAGITAALRRAKRARVSFENGGEKLDTKSLIIDTELIRYKWVSFDGNYPDWQKLIPTEFKATCHFDTIEAIRAVSSIRALSDGKEPYIDLTIGNGKIVMANADDKGEAELAADTDGEVKVRFNAGYLAQVLKACGGMVDLKLTHSNTPTLFTVNGYQLVVMPMVNPEANIQAQREIAKQAQTEREAKAKVTEQAKAEAKPTEQVKADKPKAQAKPKVAVAVK